MFHQQICKHHFKRLKVKVLVTVVSDHSTPWTVAHQAPLSMDFSRQEYWSELPFLSPGDLPNPGIGPGSHALQADPLPSESLKGYPIIYDIVTSPRLLDIYRL